MKRLIPLVALLAVLAMAGCTESSRDITAPLSSYAQGGNSQHADPDSLAYDSPNNLDAIKSVAVTPLQLGDVNCSLEVLASGDGVSPAEWVSINRLAKTRALLSKASQLLGVSVTPKPNRGLVTTVRVVYRQSGTMTALPVRLYVIPIAGTASSGASAALLVARYMDTNLWVPRLLYRSSPSDWHVTEFAYRYNNVVTEMAAVHGDCIFRSSLKILEVKNAAAHAALRARLNSLARPGVPVGDGLKSVYDARLNAGGVAELALSTAIVTANNVEEEFSGSVISGAYEVAYRVWPTDSPLVAAAKNFAKQVLNRLLTWAGSSLWSFILSWLGI